VVGVSETSWEDAGRNAVETAAGSLRDLRVAEVTKMDMKVENGKVAAFRGGSWARRAVRRHLAPTRAVAVKNASTAHSSGQSY
jgi:Dodecin